MGVDTFKYGSDLIGYAVAESTFKTAVKPAAANAFRATEITMGMPVNRILMNDRRGTRSAMETVNGRTPVQPWSASGYLRPSGAAGTAPDFGDLWKHALGTETVVASTSVTYSLLKDPTALSLSIYRDLGTFFEGVYGAIVNDFSLTWNGEGPIEWSVSGIAADFTEAGNTLANGAGSAATALVVDDADFFEKYAIIQIGGDDNSGAGFQVTAVNKTTETLTLETAHTWSDNDAVAPFLPTGSFAGSPLVGTVGSLSLDNGSTTVNHVGGSLQISTGIDLLNEEFGSAAANDILANAVREVSGSFDFLVREDETYLASEFRRKVQKDVLLTFGDTAGSRLKVNMNQVELEPQQRTSPEAEAIRYSANFRALGSSGEDETTLVFD